MEEPSVNKTAFSCPHCGAYTTQTWYSAHLGSAASEDGLPFAELDSYKEFLERDKFNDPVGTRESWDWINRIESGELFREVSPKSGISVFAVCNLNVSECFHCKKISIWVHDRLLFPEKLRAALPNEDLPDEIKFDFMEARAVVEISPRGAAALLRLCIQKLMTHLGGTGKEIDKDIAALVRNGLDARTQKALDIVRVVGNEAVHPGTLDLKDDRETALRLFDLVNAVANQMITQPKQLDALYGRLPEPKRKGIETRDKKQMKNCPFSSTERRLRDAFHHWRKLEQGYFVPDGFRVDLNSFIQEARNTTFILQNTKHEVSEFDAWYQNWQDRFRSDKILTWVKDSRNRIVKQDDLELFSTCTARYIVGWDNDSAFETNFKPFSPFERITDYLLKKLPKELIVEEGIVCIERKWIDSALPETELLHATSHALSQLLELVIDAHILRASNTGGKVECDALSGLCELRELYPLEFTNTDDSRKAWIRATNREPIKYEIRPRVRPENIEEQMEKQYGKPPNLPPLEGPPSILDALERFGQAAKILLTKDKRLLPFIHAFDNKAQQIQSYGLEMPDRIGKHLVIRRVASMLERYDIGWVMLINEAWTETQDAFLAQNLSHASESKSRGECIILQTVSSDGRSINRTIPFVRTASGFEFGQPSDLEGLQNIMIPLKKAICKNL